MDNASYHNKPMDKIPTKSSTKLEMREWLTRLGISYNDTDLKVDLMAKIKAALPAKQFKTDVVAEKFTRTQGLASSRFSS